MACQCRYNWMHTQLGETRYTSKHIIVSCNSHSRRTPYLVRQLNRGCTPGAPLSPLLPVYLNTEQRPSFEKHEGVRKPHACG
jgi:hypothetical protein